VANTPACGPAQRCASSAMTKSNTGTRPACAAAICGEDWYVAKMTFVLGPRLRRKRAIRVASVVTDARSLEADLDRLAPDDWVLHFNTSTYDGDWSGVALRSVGGATKQLYPDPTATQDFADTVYLDNCPGARAALDSFRCPLLSARFLKLAAGATIREHRDMNLGFDDGELRIHVPVRTNPDVEFLLQGRRIEMREGEAWYLDLNLPHAVANRGRTDRIHLVVDCVVNDWVRALLEQGEAAGC
jgi:hypothetical protein